VLPFLNAVVNGGSHLIMHRTIGHCWTPNPSPLARCIIKCDRSMVTSAGFSHNNYDSFHYFQSSSYAQCTCYTW